MEKTSLLQVFTTEPDKPSTCYYSGAVGGDKGETASARMSPTLKELPVIVNCHKRKNLEQVPSTVPV